LVIIKFKEILNPDILHYRTYKNWVFSTLLR
jgi:hypothetical protein